MIGASGSVLIARIRFAPLQPAMCWVAPLIAAGDVDLGRDLRAGLADLVGVRPPAGDRHGARAADRAAEQRRPAPRWIAKPSAEPTPRPPLTTTFASASETRRRSRRDALATRPRGRVVERRREALDRAVPRPARPRPRAARP